MLADRYIYWESGMDILRGGDMYTNFIKYQRMMVSEFKKMQKTYGFDVVNANRQSRRVSSELQAKTQHVLQLQ